MTCYRIEYLLHHHGKNEGLDTVKEYSYSFVKAYSEECARSNFRRQMFRELGRDHMHEGSLRIINIIEIANTMGILEMIIKAAIEECSEDYTPNL